MNLSVRIVLNRWERSRDEFLDKVNGIAYASAITVNKPHLTNEDEEKLRAWVNSGDNSMYQVWFIGGNATFGLGARNFLSSRICLVCEGQTNKI